MTQPILQMRNIHKHFGRTYALRGVDFDLHAGEAHALLGENGSGKSTLMKVAHGEVDPAEGQILLRGETARFATPLQATRAGITMVPQEVPVVASISVAENIALGSLPHRYGHVDWREINSKARAALAELGSNIDVRNSVGSLSPGDRQVVSIARAIAAESSVVIFDEPTSSLTAERADALFEIIARMKRRGIAIAFISQRLQDIEAVADRVTIIRDGQVVDTLPISEANESTVTRLMIGRPLTDYFHRKLSEQAVSEDMRPVLSVRELGSGDALRGVSLDVRPGEVVGLAGLVGSGRVELVRSVFGAESSTGHVEVDGKVHSKRSPRKSIANGIALVTGDRRFEGLVGVQSVLQNLTIVHNHRISLRPINSRVQREAAAAVIKNLQIRPADLSMPVFSMSGGNQQKVVVGRWTTRPPKVLLLDEPTRGVDVGAKSEIYRVIRELAADGTAVVISSSENSELLGLCDRVVMLLGGRIVEDLPTSQLDELTIAEHIAGVHDHD